MAQTRTECTQSLRACLVIHGWFFSHSHSFHYKSLLPELELVLQRKQVHVHAAIVGFPTLGIHIYIYIHMMPATQKLVCVHGSGGSPTHANFLLSLLQIHEPPEQKIPKKSILGQHRSGKLGTGGAMHTAGGQMNHSSHERLCTVAPRPDQGVHGWRSCTWHMLSKGKMRSKFHPRVHPLSRTGHVGSQVELLDQGISQQPLLKAMLSQPLVMLQTFLHSLGECHLVLLVPSQVRLVHQILRFIFLCIHVYTYIYIYIYIYIHTYIHIHSPESFFARQKLQYTRIYTKTSKIRTCLPKLQGPKPDDGTWGPLRPRILFKALILAFPTVTGRPNC